MSNKFHLFRLSLSEREQADMFNALEIDSDEHTANKFIELGSSSEIEKTDSLKELKDKATDLDVKLNENVTREAYIKELFSKKHAFNHLGKEFHYIPSLKHFTEKTIIGRIGRSKVTSENLPPKEGLLEVKYNSWKACPIVIDPTHHKDGQKIAFNFDKDVGKPATLIKSLIKHFNKTYCTGKYHIDVDPLFIEETFWDFANNKDKIKSITFEFIAPNMFGGSDNISEEMKNFRDEEKAQRVNIKLTSDDGLESQTDRIKNSVNYTTQGGGSIKARTKGGRRYNSEDEIETTTLTFSINADPLKKVIENLKKVFGRE